jgi:endonuclease III
LDLLDDSDDDSEQENISKVDNNRHLKSAEISATPQRPLLDIESSDDEVVGANDESQDETKESSPPAQTENRFACFAHGVSDPLEKKENRPLQWRVSNVGKTNKTSAKSKPYKKVPDKKDSYVKLKDISAEEQDRITKKWHSMADSVAPLEVRRFQVLVAARLHARCQEPTVRKAMKSLQEAFKESSFSVDEVAKADPEVLAHYITNLQFYNVKAKQIVKAANEIKAQFQGMVPEDEHSLLQITGVGKVFADLLAFVNTRAAHSQATKANRCCGNKHYTVVFNSQQSLKK